MKTAKVPSLLLAIVLQVLPVTRVFLATSPVAGSSFAIVSTWIAGLAALMGSYNAVSGASTTITSSGTATGTNGTPFSYRITTGPDTANTFSAVPLPAGLTCSTGTGRITGTPTQSGVFSVLLTASDSGSPSRTVTKTLTLTILAGGGGTNPPSISTQPTSRTATNGGSTTFSVTASGSGTLRYQWRTNGVSVTGATNSTLALSSITTNQAGSYAVVITNNYGSITSSTATLTVLVPPSITSQPSGLTVTAGQSASFTAVAAGTAPLGYNWRKNGAAITGANSATYTLPSTITGDSGSYTVVVTNSAGSITSSVASLTVNAAPVAPSITTQPTSRTVTNGGSTTFTVVAAGTAPFGYQWRTNGTPLSGATSSTLSLSGITTDQAGNYTVVISNSVGSVTSSTAVLTVLVPPSITTQPSGLTVTAGQSASFTVVAAGTATLGYRWRKNGTFITGANSATYTLPSTITGDSGSYTVVVTNSAGSITSSVASLTVNAAPVAPSITSQPTNQTGTVGGSLTLTVVASGTGTLAYQWRHDGSDVTDGTNASLSLSSLTTNDAGAYAVVVTNSVGSITSAVATVTVNPAPVAPGIAAQPESVTVTAGSNATFNVTATGTAPLRYQWRKAGVVVATATNATLAFTPALLINAGDYTVVITNVAGAVTSSVATLTVTNPPVADLIRPTLTVLSPAAALTLVTSNTINLTGTAADNEAVTSVLVQHNGGAAVEAGGTTFWSTAASLAAGTNTFLIKATDAAGNFSITNTRVVVYKVNLPLSLTINGAGLVSGATNGQLLELGKSYALKATAKPGNVFSNWLVNGESSSVAALAFTMASNLTVVANFVTNPFATLKGSYSGLFYPNAPEPPHEQSGSFTLAVTDKGTYSGKLLLAGATYPVSGLLDLSLAATKTILRKGTNEVVLSFQLTVGSDAVSGSVSNVAWLAELSGYRAGFDAKLNPATNHSGKYTMLLSGGEDAAASPAGQSPAILDITTAGVVSLKGTLSDGTAIAQKMTLAANGQTPVYVNLYKGKGSLIGWMTVLNTDTNDTPGLLLWTKKETAGGKVYLAGFTNEALALGSRYVVPARGSAALGWSNGVVSMEQGNLTVSVTNDIALSSANKFFVALPNTNKLALTLTPASGLLGGSFVHPDTLKKSALKGVILQKQQVGGGYFLGTNQSGMISLNE